MAKAALTKLFGQSHFSICVVRDLCKLTGRPTDTPAFLALKLLHCIDYDRMSEQLLQSLPRLVNECLAPPPVCVATDIALQGVELDHG